MIRFVEMTDVEFQSWRSKSILEYFTERVRAGNDDESPERAEREFASLLPYGRLTRNHYVLSILAEDDLKVGVIWYAVDTGAFPKDTLFIYDIEVDEMFRGRGYGTAALLLLEAKARELGKQRIALHVFAHNVRARLLYEELGYKPTNVMMAKELSS